MRRAFAFFFDSSAFHLETLPLLPFLADFFLTLELWILTLTKASESCSSLDLVLGSWVITWNFKIRRTRSANKPEHKNIDKPSSYLKSCQLNNKKKEVREVKCLTPRPINGKVTRWARCVFVMSFTVKVLLSSREMNYRVEAAVQKWGGVRTVARVLIPSADHQQSRVLLQSRSIVSGTLAPSRLSEA